MLTCHRHLVGLLSTNAAVCGASATLQSLFVEGGLDGRRRKEEINQPVAGRQGQLCCNTKHPTVKFQEVNHRLGHPSPNTLTCMFTLLNVVFQLPF